MNNKREWIINKYISKSNNKRRYSLIFFNNFKMKVISSIYYFDFFINKLSFNKTKHGIN
jgi:hypothetical protein